MAIDAVAARDAGAGDGLLNEESEFFFANNDPPLEAPNGVEGAGVTLTPPDVFAPNKLLVPPAGEPNEG